MHINKKRKLSINKWKPWQPDTCALTFGKLNRVFFKKIDNNDSDYLAAKKDWQIKELMETSNIW